MALSTTKNFSTRAVSKAGFFNENAEPRLNIEGTVSIADESLVANVNVDSSSASYGGTYIAKVAAANSEDFNVVYTSVETVTFSNYPAGITGLHADDIELVRQINSSGAVVESYTRDDAIMSVTGDILTVSGASFSVTDTFVILTNIQSSSSGSSSGGVGGGNNTYSNASGDFTAVITDSTSNVTITGLSFTLEDIHVAMGAIKLIAVSGVVTDVALTDVSVSSGVITLADQPTFSTGDVVVVSLIGPDKAYDEAIDSQISTILNPNYAHYTSVEHLIEESNLGITGTATGTDINTLTNSGASWSDSDIAVGYEAYSEEEDIAVTVLSLDSSTSMTTDNITVDWTGDTYWVPECKRFVIPAEGFNHMAVHVRLSTGDVNNAAYCKIYATLDEDADDTIDNYWVDISSDVFGAAQLSSTGDASTEGIYFIDTPTTVLKYMIKIVGEVFDGGAAAATDQAFDVYVKRSS